MDIKVTGRHCTVTPDFEDRAREKMSRVEKLADRAFRVEVQLTAYGNRRQPEESARVEITLLGKGPVVRAEAHAQDKFSALEGATDRLVAQLRRASDRKKVRRGRAMSLQQATAQVPAELLNGAPVDEPAKHTVAGMEVTGEGPLIVREKTHEAAPMTLDQALNEMELVGHDWYLFVDTDNGRPSVVYRRRAYDYGVIHLDVVQQEARTA